MNCEEYCTDERYPVHVRQTEYRAAIAASTAAVVAVAVMSVAAVAAIALQTHSFSRVGWSSNKDQDEKKRQNQVSGRKKVAFP